MTDPQLLAAAIQKAGSLTLLSQVSTMPDRVTLWRWQRAGAISNDRQRARLQQYLSDDPPAKAA